jgi:chemotaxis protein MotB
MRRKKHAEHVNHERWLVSYADFITLLFAFFVVMFAVSQVDSKKVGRFTESFSRAVGIGVFQHSGRGILPGIEGVIADPRRTGSNDEPPTVSLEDLHALLIAATSQNDAIANIQVLRRRNEFVLRLPETILFASGEDSVKDPAVRALRTLATTLRTHPVDVRIEGHTDNRPIRTSRFRSNWELSTARATAVLVWMLAGEGIAPERMSAAGYGEFHPIASNDTEPGRQQNRRVDLVVSVHAAVTEEEVPLDTTGDGGTSDASAATPVVEHAPEHASEPPSEHAPEHASEHTSEHGAEPSSH